MHRLVELEDASRAEDVSAVGLDGEVRRVVADGAVGTVVGADPAWKN